jgi:hypothetical protein
LSAGVLLWSSGPFSCLLLLPQFALIFGESIASGFVPVFFTTENLLFELFYLTAGLVGEAAQVPCQVHGLAGSENYQQEEHYEYRLLGPYAEHPVLRLLPGVSSLVLRPGPLIRFIHSRFLLVLLLAVLLRLVLGSTFA